MLMRMLLCTWCVCCITDARPAVQLRLAAAVSSAVRCVTGRRQDTRQPRGRAAVQASGCICTRK